MRDFFQHNAYRQERLSNFQVFDFEGLAGRVRSSSYVPAQDHPNFVPMIAELERVFRAHQQDGTVRIEYQTHLYFGRLQAGTDA
jgi:hypothetical protein